MSLFQRLHGPLPTPDWDDIESVTDWIEYVRSDAFFSGARHKDISRVEATALVAAIEAMRPNTVTQGREP